MKAFECSVQVTPEGKVVIPPDLVKKLPVSQVVRAIFLVSEPERDDEDAWAKLTAEQFAAGYSEADAVYDGV